MSKWHSISIRSFRNFKFNQQIIRFVLPILLLSDNNNKHYIIIPVNKIIQINLLNGLSVSITIETMAPISSVVDKLILGKEDQFCQLCFGDIGPTAIKVQDEIIVNKTKPQNTKEMSEILTFILGGHVSKNNLFLSVLV